MTQGSAKPQSNVQRAARALRALIFSGELPPGSDHLETELAEHLGMSRTPVREAALVLEGQGLLEVRPRKGVRIVPVSAADMREVYDVLTALESLAAERAAQIGYSGPELRPLADAIARMDAAITARNLEVWAQADEDFHRELVRLARNTRITQITDQMGDQVRRARNVTLHLRPLPAQSNADHRAVLEAIRAGEAEKAGAIHRRHRERSGKMLVDLLSHSGLRRV